MNASLTESWATLAQKYTALQARERWMVSAAVLCVFYAIFSFLISPVLARQQTLKTEIATDQAQSDNLTQQLNLLNQQHANDPDTVEKQRIKVLKANLVHLESEVKQLKTTFISPEKMPDLLGDLLESNAQLKLIALKTLPTKGLLDKEVNLDVIKPSDKLENIAANDAQALPIFKHGVEMTIEGRYLDLLDYVAGVEKMPWHVVWNKADLKVDSQSSNQFPNSQLTLTVYTLSLDKTWLSI